MTEALARPTLLFAIVLIVLVVDVDLDHAGVAEVRPGRSAPAGAE